MSQDDCETADWKGGGFSRHSEEMVLAGLSEAIRKCDLNVFHATICALLQKMSVGLLVDEGTLRQIFMFWVRIEQRFWGFHYLSYFRSQIQNRY